jgi:hypothetical protein
VEACTSPRAARTKADLLAFGSEEMSEGEERHLSLQGSGAYPRSKLV